MEKFQFKILVAYREGNYDKVYKLQETLVNSFAAYLKKIRVHPN